MSRRDEDSTEIGLVCGSLTINLRSKMIKVKGSPVLLSPLEFGVVVYLAKNQDRPVSPEELLVCIWGNQDGGTVGQVRSCIKRIREKLRQANEDETSSVRYIKTIRGWGYRMYIPDDTFL